MPPTPMGSTDVDLYIYSKDRVLNSSVLVLHQPTTYTRGPLWRFHPSLDCQLQTEVRQKQRSTTDKLFDDSIINERLGVAEAAGVEIRLSMFGIPRRQLRSHAIGAPQQTHGKHTMRSFSLVPHYIYTCNNYLSHLECPGELMLTKTSPVRASTFLPASSSPSGHA